VRSAVCSRPLRPDPTSDPGLSQVLNSAPDTGRQPEAKKTEVPHRPRDHRPEAFARCRLPVTRAHPLASREAERDGDAGVAGLRTPRPAMPRTLSRCGRPPTTCRRLGARRTSPPGRPQDGHNCVSVTKNVCTSLGAAPPGWRARECHGATAYSCGSRYRPRPAPRTRP
jgi:hypothetical protein